MTSNGKSRFFFLRSGPYMRYPAYILKKQILVKLIINQGDRHD
jgi:hypothetical protein